VRFLFCSLLAVSLTQTARADFTYLDDEAEPGGYDVSAQITSIPANIALARAENGDGYTLRFDKTSVRLEIVRSGKTSVLASSPFKAEKFRFDLSRNAAARVGAL
jgi:hypothetical protein